MLSVKILLFGLLSVTIITIVFCPSVKVICFDQAFPDIVAASPLIVTDLIPLESLTEPEIVICEAETVSLLE